MKHLKNLALVALSISLIGVACTRSTSTDPTTDYVGNWVRKGAVDGNGRSGAVSFVINNKAYIGTGYDGTSRYNDLIVFDPTTGGWEQKASMPTAAGKRNLASAFAIGTKGYVVGGACDANLGYSGKLNDVWEYDAAMNMWTATAKASLPDPNATVGSGARYSSVGFGIGSKGYISTGYTGTHTKDIWEYDPAMDMWKQLPSMPSSDKRQGASVFVYNNMAYIFGGSSNGTTVNDMWKFNPANATSPWTQLRNISNTSTEDYDDKYTSIMRSNGASFIIGDKGYYTTGQNGANNPTTWEYDFANDTWTQKTTYERSSRTDAVGFAVNGRGFVATGSSSTLYFDNMDEFLPTATYSSTD